jgi:uncharacterized membrane protein
VLGPFGARRQAAQAVVWVVLMMPLFLTIAGLMIDSGQILDARREAQNLADGAARIAAMQIDITTLHTSPTSNVVMLNPAKAQSAANTYLQQHEHGSGWLPAYVPPSTSVARVTVWRRVPTTFLRIVKVDSLVTVSATAEARPCAGITATGPVTC